jgi:cation diffusion facilitator CzcD-associated flavoprotein CzcO
MTTTSIFTNHHRNPNEINVAIIGGGPGGMCLIHHIRNHMKNGSKYHHVNITCFERTSRPGGIWRSPIHQPSTTKRHHHDDNHHTNTTTTSTTLLHNTETDMYDQLWTNGPCHGIEFFDYPFDEHFLHQPVHVYLKRQQLLEYMIGRVTKHDPNIFDECMQFHKEVIHVTYHPTTHKFIINVKDLTSGHITSMNNFDQCVWACGLCGKQSIPRNIMDKFHDGQFTGTIIHSAQTELLERDVREKRILLIGGAYSAEDMAYQSIKLGAKQIYIVSRLTNSEVSIVTAWPYNQVQVLLGKEVKAIVKGGTCIQLRDIEWTFNGYQPVNDNDAACEELYDIDTVIFCTGYQPCLQMLDDELNQGLPGAESYFHNPYTFDSGEVNSNESEMKWQMKPNVLTEYIGDDVPFSSQLKYLTDIVHPNFYHGVLISNPKMMFLTDYESIYPLLSIDAHAWFLARVITGIQCLPTVHDMQQYNIQTSHDMLHNPYHRMSMDENYCHTLLTLPNFWSTTDPFEEPEPYRIASDEGWKYTFALLAQFMYQNQYPLSLWNDTNQTLSENGETLYKYSSFSNEHRWKLKEYLQNHDDDDKARNQFDQTYRDYTNGNDFQSILTGTSCMSSLPKKWLDMEE